MSALGQKRTFSRSVTMSAIPPKAGCPLSARSGHSLRGAWEVPPAVEDSIRRQAGYVPFKQRPRTISI
jgi:hypothetical protein